jgi:hypothetical protein
MRADFIAKCDAELIQRVKKIVSLTVEDFYNSGYSTDESPKSLKAWLCDALNTYEGLEDYTTIEISLQVLKLLNSLDIVDLEYIHSVVLEEHTQASEVSITFKEVVL